MSPRWQWLRGAPRGLAVVLGGAAVAIALQTREKPPELPTTEELAVGEPEPTGSNPPAPTNLGSGWLLRSGGWYIRVDGAEIELPSFARATPDPKLEEIACPLSPFDDLIVRQAKLHGFDWRLIAALIFEESRFKPDSLSSKGAVGLMQVRAIAAEQVGMERFHAPSDNIQAGVKYLRHLDGLFDSARGEDRLRLVLAAYNMGPSHVRDAQSLAQRYGYDPNRWNFSMDRILPLLEEPRFHKDLPSGFARGRDTVSYVDRVVRRYEQYQREMSDAPAITADALSSDDRFEDG